MAERFSRKITVFILLAVLFSSASAFAEEKFTNYKEAGAQAAAEPGTIQPAQLRTLIESGQKILVLDARAKEEYDSDRLPGAKLPRGTDYYREMEMFRQQIVRQAPSSKKALENAMKDIPHATPIITYCHSHCGLSKTLKLDLEDLGFTNVRWLDGGIDDWREKGFPTEK